MLPIPIVKNYYAAFSLILLGIFQAIYMPKILTTHIILQLLFEQIHLLKNSGFIAVGGVSPSTIIKLDNQGNTIHTTTIPNTASKGTILPTSDGGYIYLTSILDNSNTTLYLEKYDEQSTTLWSKSLPNISVDQITPESIIQLTDGSYAIFGQSSNTPFLLKVDADGNQLLKKDYTTITRSALAIEETPNGDFFLLCRSENLGIDILKTDAQGNILWKRTHEDYSNKINSLGSIKATQNGGVIFVGDYNGFAILLKYNALGNINWTKSYGHILEQQAAQVQPTSDGGYILVGSTINALNQSPNTFVLKTDAQGNENWSHIYNIAPQSEGLAIKELDAGGYIVAGNQSNLGHIFTIDASGILKFYHSY